MSLREEKESRKVRKIVNIVTRNIHKFREAAYVLSRMGIESLQIPIKRIEIQSDNLEDIAIIGAKSAAKKLGRPVVVEDAGLFIDSLNGFPGPYSSYVFKTLGINGILKLMSGIENRRAKFVSVVAYCDPSGMCHVFKGIVWGKISLNPRGSGGFGFDPIFEPDNCKGLTYAELSFERKCEISHRAQAFKSFASWFLSIEGNNS